MFKLFPLPALLFRERSDLFRTKSSLPTWDVIGGTVPGFGHTCLIGTTSQGTAACQKIIPESVLGHRPLLAVVSSAEAQELIDTIGSSNTVVCDLTDSGRWGSKKIRPLPFRSDFSQRQRDVGGWTKEFEQQLLVDGVDEQIDISSIVLGKATTKLVIVWDQKNTLQGRIALSLIRHTLCPILGMRFEETLAGNFTPENNSDIGCDFYISSYDEISVPGFYVVLLQARGMLHRVVYQFANGQDDPEILSTLGQCSSYAIFDGKEALKANAALNGGPEAVLYL